MLMRNEALDRAMTMNKIILKGVGISVRKYEPQYIVTAGTKIESISEFFNSVFW